MRHATSLILTARLVGLAAAAASGLVACRADVSDDPPVLLERNMFDQEKYKAQSFSPYFADHRTMRTPVEGTFQNLDEKTKTFEDQPEIATGMTEDGQRYVATVPQAAIDFDGVYRGFSYEAGPEKMVERGRARFNIYCVPCHSKIGDGKGTVALRGPIVIPSFTDPRLRGMADGQVFATITHGKGNMPAYAAQINVKDRWAIVTYLRALQLSQVSLVTPQEKK